MLGSSSTKVLTYVTATDAAGGGSPQTFATVSIGTAAYDRRVILAVAAGGGATVGTVTGITVGGVSATKIVEQLGAGNQTRSQIWIALVPSGTTADIILTYSASVSQFGIGVWNATGLSVNTAFASGGSTADPGTATLACTGGGFCVSLAATFNLSTSLTWTNVTEKYDQVQGTQLTHSGASIATVGGTIAPSGDYASGTGDEAAVFATW